MYNLTVGNRQFGLKFVHFVPKSPVTHMRDGRKPFTYKAISTIRLYEIKGKVIELIGQGVLRVALSDNLSKPFARKEGFRRAILDAAKTVTIFQPRLNGEVVVGRPLRITKLSNDGKLPYEVRKGLWNQFFEHFDYSGRAYPTYKEAPPDETPTPLVANLPVIEGQVVAAETISPTVH